MIRELYKKEKENYNLVVELHTAFVLGVVKDDEDIFLCLGPLLICIFKK